MNPKAQKELDPSVLLQAMWRRLPRRISGQGQITFPAVPALLELYVETLNTIFASYGRIFTDEELSQVRSILQTQLKDAFAASPYSKVTIDFRTDDPPSMDLSYTISYSVSTIADEYADWVSTRQPPLFGTQPDAKIRELARSLGPPAEAPVLDIGAGTGRNTLPLAEAGFPTDAVELAPALANVLRRAIKHHNLPSRVFQGDVLDANLDIPTSHYRLIVAAEVVATHCRGSEQIRKLLERVSELLVPGGLFVFNMFLCSDGYEPDAVARELSETMWCPIFTRREVEEATTGLPLTQISDESTYKLEREHSPQDAWPPTGWFTEWTHGQDLFDIPADKSPSELRWLVYRRDC